MLNQKFYDLVEPCVFQGKELSKNIFFHTICMIKNQTCPTSIVPVSGVNIGRAGDAFALEPMRVGLWKDGGPLIVLGVLV